MLKKIAIYIFLVLIMCCAQALAAQQDKTSETITITTYYPSPYGSYNELHTNYLQFGKVPFPPTQLTNCKAEEEGKIVYNSKEKDLYFCDGKFWNRISREYTK